MNFQTIKQAILEKKKINFFYYNEKVVLSPWILAKLRGKIILVGHEEFPKIHKSKLIKKTLKNNFLVYNKKNEKNNLNRKIKVFIVENIFNLDIIDQPAIIPYDNVSKNLNPFDNAISVYHPARYDEILAKVSD